MECASEFQELANHNSFVQELVDDCYDVDFIGGYFVIYGVPYLDKDGKLQHGDLASPVDLAGNAIEAPSSHQFWFRGCRPHDNTGRELRLSPRPHNVTITKDFITDHSFSLKLLNSSGQKRNYLSFEEKVRTYLDVITSPAMDAYPEATPLRNIERKAAEQGSPLRFPDTLSSRYHINDLSSLLRGKTVAIIGLGGTGSYILDMIARTHLEKITLFDDDKVHVHTIFRMPGFVPKAIGKNKVDVLAQQYGQWHTAIVPVSERINSNNIEQLREFDFVFVSVDDGPSRLSIVSWLMENAIPFVDCGMGLNRLTGGLNGVVRITGVDRSAVERTVNTCYLPTEKQPEDEYRKHAQIAEFNALNACLAVIRFKQHFNLYDRLEDSAWYTFKSASFDLDKEQTKMMYRYLAVERIPDELATDVVYHNEDFEIAALLCACGCGHRITLLVPDSHQISSENGLVTIKPSIAVCDADCKSHYYITAGKWSGCKRSQVHKRT